jgi:hypothetical protein
VSGFGRIECDLCAATATEVLRFRWESGWLTKALCPVHVAEETKRLGEPFYWLNLGTSEEQQYDDQEARRG